MMRKLFLFSVFLALAAYTLSHLVLFKGLIVTQMEEIFPGHVDFQNIQVVIFPKPGIRFLNFELHHDATLSATELLLTFDRIKIHEGHLRYKDFSLPSFEASLPQINFQRERFEITGAEVSIGPATLTLNAEITQKETLYIIAAALKTARSDMTLHLNISGPDNSETLWAEGEWASEYLEHGPYVFTKVRSVLRYENKTLLLEELEGQVFQGSFSGSAVLSDLEKENPSFSIVAKADRIDVNHLLEAATGEANLVTGTASLDLELSGNLRDRESLSGAGDVEIRDGAISKLKLLNEGTPFEFLSLPFSIENGVMTMPHLTFEEDRYHVSLEGLMNLDLALNLKGHYTLTVKQGEIPITITGFLTQPKLN